MKTLLFILTLAQTAPQAASGTIEGTAVNAVTMQPIPNVAISLRRDDPAAPAADPAPLTGDGTARILLSQAVAARAGAPEQKVVLTDQSGRFAIPNLSPGAYIVSTQLDGYFGPSINGTNPLGVVTNIKLTDSQTSNVTIALVPGGTISGMVLDELGLPAFNTTVQVLRVVYPNGVPTVQNGVPSGQNAGAQATDDRGNYRLYGLPPGEYYIAVTPKQAGGARGGRAGGSAAESVSEPATPAPPGPVRTYFPNATVLWQGSPLHLHAGEEISGINLNIQLAAKARISGVVVSSIPAAEMVFPAAAQTGRGGAAAGPNATLTLYPHGNALQDPSSASGVSISMGNPANGRFEIPNVSPGIYDLYASLPDINGYGPAQPPGSAVQPVAYGRTTINIHGGDLEGVTVAVHHGVEIKGRVTIDGGPSPSINNVGISLQADDSASKIQVYQQVGRYRPAIDTDGSFTIPAVPEAQYRVGVTFGPPAPAPAAPGNSSGLIREALNAGTAQRVAAPAIQAARGAAELATTTFNPQSTPVATVSLPNIPLAGPPLGPNAYVADILQGGMSVYDSGIVVSAQAVEPLEVRVKTDGGSVDGIVLNAMQMPVPGATVVLAPPTQRRQNPALYKTAASDAAGRFSITGLPPGEYKMFAFDSIPPGVYQNADFVKNYDDKAVSVNVSASIHINTQVSLIADTR